jgi:HEAT repeat protein
MQTLMLTLAACLAPLAPPDEKEVTDALAAFKKGMANPSGPARAAAVSELARVPHEKTAKTLAGMLSGDVPSVRRAAAIGLGGFADYKKLVVPILLSSITPNLKEPEVVEGIFQALGKLDDDSALSTIHRYFEDKNDKIASAALLAAGEIRHVSSVDPILDLMKKYDKIVEQAKKGGGGAYGTNIPGGGDDPKRKLAEAVLPNAIKAMQAIAKEKYASFKEWTIWWNRYKATFKTD